LANIQISLTNVYLHKDTFTLCYKTYPAVQCLCLCDTLLSMRCMTHQVKIQQILKLIASILTVTNNTWNKFTKCWFAKKLLRSDKPACFRFSRLWNEI